MHKTISGLTLLTAAATLHAQTQVLYVDDDASPGGDGSTWDDAYTDLQDALDAIVVDGAVSAEIRIAAGVYIAPEGGYRADIETQSAASLAIVGAFSGMNFERDPDRFTTILSGDRLGDDEPGFRNRDDNVANVLVLDDPLFEGRLDGLDIVSGGTSGIGTGGGVHVESAARFEIIDCRFEDNVAMRGGALSSGNVNLRIERCAFIGNHANDLGGAAWVEGFRNGVTFQDALFRDNEAGLDGGALLFDTNGSYEVNDCVFDTNRAGREGGAICTDAFTDIGNSLFVDNDASLGGAISTLDALDLHGVTFRRNLATERGGAIVALSTVGAVTARRSGFFDNAAFRGGAIYGQGACDLENCLFDSNEGVGAAVAMNGFGDDWRFGNCTFLDHPGSIGGAIDLEGDICEGTIVNSIIWSGEAIPVTIRDAALHVEHTILLDGEQGVQADDATVTFGDAIIDAPPMLDARDVPTRMSPAIDAGRDDQATDVRDFDGELRFLDGDGNGSWTVDLGALEYQAECPADLNLDGTLDINDILDFLAAFDAQEQGADWNRDGALNVFDAIDYLADFDSGC